ncbi:MAG: YwaF family protein [Christensenellaceae bacterium]|nr:YwaF family protein [Christensenellaceae bacterium]
MYSAFNLVHIGYILLLPLVLVLGYYALKRSPPGRRTVVLLLCLFVCAVFEFYDMFSNLKYGPKTIFLNMPLYACDLNIFILIFALLKKGKKQIINKFILYYCTTGPIFTLLVPMINEGVYSWHSNEIAGTFIPHILYVVVSILYLIFNAEFISYRKPYKPFLSMIIMISLVHIINLILIKTNLNAAANYMFTMNAEQIEFVSVASRFLGSESPIIRNYFVMCLGYLMLTIAAYFVHRAYCVLAGRKRDFFQRSRVQ